KTAYEMRTYWSSDVCSSDLNLGDPDLQTPPEIIEAAYQAMKAGKTKYSSAYGEPKLRQKIAEMHGVKIENVIITPGSKWGVFARSEERRVGKECRWRRTEGR